MSEIIIICQAEAARLPNDSTKTLCTIGLYSCVGAVLRGSNGFTLIHIDAHTDLTFLIEEMLRLGAGSTIELFRWVDGGLGVTQKVIAFINAQGILFDLNDVQLLPRSDLPYGILAVEAHYAGHRTRLGGMLNFGPQDFQMRSFKQQIFTYLNPRQHKKPHIIYDMNEWCAGYELCRDDLIILNSLLEIANDKDALYERVCANLTGFTPDSKFFDLLMHAKTYMMRHNLSFETPTADADSGLPMIDASASTAKRYGHAAP
jgi:hypothetical protein